MITLLIILLILNSSKKSNKFLIKKKKKPSKKLNIEEEERKQERKYSDASLLGRLIGYLKGHVTSVVIAFILMILGVITELVCPLLVGEIYDTLASDVIDKTKIIVIIIVYVVLLLSTSIIAYYQTMILQKTGQRIIYQLREDTFVKIEAFSQAQFNQVPVGKLVTRVTSDVMAINQMYTDVIINLIRNILMIIGVIIAMFCVSVKLTLYVLMITPLVIVFSVIFRKFSRKAYRDVRRSISSVNASLSENISGMKITQSFNQEDKQFRVFNQQNERLRKNSDRQTFVFAIFRPSIYVLYIFTIVVILYIGSEMMLSSNYGLKLSVFIIFYQYIERLYNPIQRLAEQFNVLQSSFSAAERVFDIIDTTSDIVDSDDAIELETLKGDIEFKHVWFAYNDEEWILKDVSFKINAKETVAFVGATGSGKTTILGLIVRNYDIQKGQILIDGIDIKQIKVESLRHNIGQMLQDVFLFSGTIRSNINLREEKITDEVINEACSFVNADKVIEKLPKGLDEEVKERGNNFSAGERQLLSFARVVAHKPSVMILDEATANIDTETESLIQDSLNKMMNIGTMLIVAHRLSTIQHADNIIVLKKGRIIEQGTHQALLALGGYYYNLYLLQYKHQEK